MKSKSDLTDPGALSFEAGPVANETVPAIPDPPPRPASERDREFVAPQAAFTNEESPEKDGLPPTGQRPGRAGKSVKTVKLGRWLLMPPTRDGLDGVEDSPHDDRDPSARPASEKT
jgi:hypothetical protein